MLFRLALVLALAVPATLCQAQARPSLDQISEMIDVGDGGAESLLMSLHAENPDDAGVMALLGRVWYQHAVDGRAQRRDGLDISHDPGHMRTAMTWVERATKTDPNHANAWIVYGQILNAQGRREESLKMLERAEALDPSSVKLRLRKGATLRSLAAYTGDDTWLQAAAREYELAIKGRIDDGNEVTAASYLAQIHWTFGDYAKAKDYLTRAIDAAQGSERAYMLETRARTHLEAGQVEASIADSLAALQVMPFQLAVTTLADALLVKAGQVMRDQGDEAATPHINAFLQTRTNPTHRMLQLVSKKTTFPAIYALMTPRLRAAGMDQVAARTVSESAPFVTPADLRKLHSLGLRFDTPDEIQGTLLHRAIAANRVDVVRTLLELGVDASVPMPGGTTTLQLASTGTRPERKEIRSLLFVRLGTPPGWKEPDFDLPEKGRWYRAERTIGLLEPRSVQIKAGMTLMAGSRCRTPHRPYHCQTFYTRPGEIYGTLLLPIANQSDFKWLREVPAPK